mmetsp:Transcript_77313/g.218625  ORF Transcript_77313/g.218625 Transcript_77313/m.218625 type:complete len:430 (+) Transcript_77313:74-1363(+)
MVRLLAIVHVILLRSLASCQGQKLALGAQYTCSLQENRKVVCWGSNISGQVTHSPVSKFIVLTGGNAHVCGLLLKNNHTVCWGFNTTSVPLHPEYPPPPGSNFSKYEDWWKTVEATEVAPHEYSDWHGTPHDPPSGSFMQLTSGFYHNCGLRVDGTATCWGKDMFGEVSQVPNEKFSFIDAGGSRTCGILQEDRTVRCWGLHHMKKGEKKGKYYKAYHTVRVGEYHVCGLEEYSRMAVCWGFNLHGQADPPLGVAFADICAGGDHTCGIRWDDNSVVCWGANSCQQLATPPKEYHFKSIVCGVDHTCGELQDGGVHCWGGLKPGQTPRADPYVIDLPGASYLVSRPRAVSSALVQETSAPVFSLRLSDKLKKISNVSKKLSIPLNAAANFMKSFSTLNAFIEPAKADKAGGKVRKAALKTQWNGGFLAM